MNKENRIKTTLSKCQWEIIYSKFKGVTKESPEKIKKKALQSHITSELKKIATKCDELPDSQPCVECKQQVSVWLSNSSAEDLDYIAKKTGISDPGLIVSKFIINPLLLRD